MDTKERGEITEAKVKAYLMEKGYTVLVPEGEHSRYDLVVDGKSGFKKVQVKTAWMKDGVLIFNCQSTRSNMSETVDKPYTANEVDVYVVYSPDTGRYYWIPFEEAPRTRMHLRLLDPGHPTPQINYAEDYLL